MAQDLDALARQFGGQPSVNVTISSNPNAQPPADIEFEQLAKQFVGMPDDLSQVGQRVPVSDTPMDLVRGIGAGAAQAVNPLPTMQMIGQLAPVPKAVPGGGGIPLPKAIGGSGMDSGTVKVLQGVLHSSQPSIDRMFASYKKGDPIGTIAHAIDWLLPVIGPMIDEQVALVEQGRPWRGVGEAIGSALGFTVAPKVLDKAISTGRIALRNPNPAEAAAVTFGQQRGVPVDAGTATGNFAVKGVQGLADRSILGSIRQTGRVQEGAAALERVGGELADRARSGSVTPEQAGTSVGDYLRSKSTAHTDLADVSYRKLREAENLPTNQLDVPLKAAPVDALGQGQIEQLRRIVHELDAMPHTQRLLRRTRTGNTLEHVEGTGGEGATVYHDIIDRLTEGNPTRGAVQEAIEEYLGGGKENAYVKAAKQVAAERSAGRAGDGGTVAKPELDASAGNILTRLEKTRKKFETIGLPVHLEPVKAALKPVVAQLERQLPLTQQLNHTGLHAMRQILDGPDWAPLSVADRDLSAMKRLAREQGGLVKVAVSKLEAAVSKAAGGASPEVAQYLKQGRQATIAKYATEDVLDSVKGAKGEPVGTFRNVMAPHDGKIAALRALAKETPQAIPGLARAFLDDLLNRATSAGAFDKADGLQATWAKLGPETKKILFPEPGQIQELDNFFLLAKKLNFNPNPSGSGWIVSLAGQLQQGASALGQAGGGSYIFGLVPTFLTQVGAAGLSELLHSQRFVKALNNGIRLSIGRAPRAAQAAAVGRMVAAAKEAGVTIPAVADQETPQAPTAQTGAGR